MTVANCPAKKESIQKYKTKPNQRKKGKKACLGSANGLLLNPTATIHYVARFHVRCEKIPNEQNLNHAAGDCKPELSILQATRDKAYTIVRDLGDQVITALGWTNGQAQGAGNLRKILRPTRTVATAA